MARTIDYLELSRSIRRYYVQNLNSVVFESFFRAVKTFLTKPEAKSLFDYYLKKEKILVENGRKYKFNCRQDHFEPDAVRSLFINGFIKTSPRKCSYNRKSSQVKEVKEPISPKNLSDKDLDAAINALVLEKKRRAISSKFHAFLSEFHLTKEEFKTIFYD